MLFTFFTVRKMGVFMLVVPQTWKIGCGDINPVKFLQQKNDFRCDASIKKFFQKNQTRLIVSAF